MLVGALRVFPRTVLPRHRPKSSMRQTGADSPAPSRTVHWTVCVPLWRERAVRIPSLREKQKALSPDGERAFCGRSDGIRTHGLLVPNQARYQLRYTPERKNRSSCAAAVWLGMRGSNSHGRSQSPLHYHYANPHRNHRCGRLPSTLIYYSVWETVCQQLFQTFLQKSVKIRKSAQLRLTFLLRLRAPTALAGGKDARVHLGHGHRQRPHRRAEHERDDGHVPYPLFQLVGGVVLITAGDA